MISKKNAEEETSITNLLQKMMKTTFKKVQNIISKIDRHNLQIMHGSLPVLCNLLMFQNVFFLARAEINILEINLSIVFGFF